MSDIKEERQVTQQVTVGWICDQCGREEDDKGVVKTRWLSFSIGHHGWGTNSSESIQRFDVCSAACFIALGLKEGEENLEGYDDQGAEIAEMPWLFFKELAKMASQAGVQCKETTDA